MTTPVLTEPNAVRIFWGHRHPRLSEAEFRRELGDTFMPGTPYMLAPLGLHAYAAAVFDEDAVRDTPHESGLIAYPSQAAYRAIRSRNLRGRLYTHTHAAIYHEYNPDGTRRSAAQFAEPFTDGLDDAARTVHLLPESIDLQQGVLTVHLCVPTDLAQVGASFRRTVRAGLPSLRDALRDLDYSQAFVAVRDNYLVIWLHSLELGGVDPIDDWLPRNTRLVRLEAEHVPILEDAPLVTIDGPSAFNFIFTRSASAGFV
jgi:hypothetical protein